MFYLGKHDLISWGCKLRSFKMEIKSFFDTFTNILIKPAKQQPFFPSLKLPYLDWGHGLRRGEVGWANFEFPQVSLFLFQNKIKKLNFAPKWPCHRGLKVKKISQYYNFIHIYNARKKVHQKLKLSFGFFRNTTFGPFFIEIYLCNHSLVYAILSKSKNIILYLKILFFFFRFFSKSHYGNHRRRKEREGKAKVVTSVWGQNLLNSLPR